MSLSRPLLAVMATLAVLAAVPATGSATSSTGSASADVRVNADKAQKAIKRMMRAARAGDGAAVVRQLRVARSQAAAASRKARAMTKGDDSVAAAQALTLAGTTYEELIAAITKLVDEITGRAQESLAQAIKPSIAGQQTIIGTLASLLDDVPSSIQQILASIVTGLAVGDADEVVNMDTAIDGGSLPTSIADIVAQALGLATQSIDKAFAGITSIVPLLPPAVQGPLWSILGTVTGSLGTIVPSALSTVTALVDTILSSLPFAASGKAGGGLTGIFGGLLDGILGGGQAALPGNTGDTLRTLLGRLFRPGSGTGTGTTTGSTALAPSSYGRTIAKIMKLIEGVLADVLDRRAAAPAG